jgi:hypothetical protein
MWCVIAPGVDIYLLMRLLRPSCSACVQEPQRAGGKGGQGAGQGHHLVGEGQGSGSREGAS